MERKSGDSQEAGSMSFKTALATLDTPDKPASKRHSIFAGMSFFTPKKAAATSSISDIDVISKASAQYNHDLDETPKASTQKHQAIRASQLPQESEGELSQAQKDQQRRGSRLYQASEERKAESTQAQYDQQRYEPAPSKPIPIPNAIPKVRLPIQRSDGLIVMTASRAPVTQEHVELLQKIDQEDIKVKEEYRRLKQGMMKWRAMTPAAEQDKIEKDAKRRSRAWARKSIGMVKGIFGAENSRDDKTELVPAGSPVVPKEDVRVGNAIMLGVRDQTPVSHEQVGQPVASQRHHSTNPATIEQGEWKSEAYMRGFHNGYQKARSEQDYKQGYEDGIKAFGTGLPRAAPVERPAPEEQIARGRLVRRDGTLVPQQEVAGEVARMMNNLEIRRADGTDDPEDIKGKKKQEPRLPWEIVEFVKDVEYELRSYSCT